MPMPMREADKQECPNCGFGPSFPWIMEELVSLYTPREEGEYGLCVPATRIKYPVCRRCGFVLGLDDITDPLQQHAIEYGERLEDGPVPIEEAPAIKKAHEPRGKREEG